VEIKCHLSAPTTQRKRKGGNTSREIFLLSGLAWRDCWTLSWHLTPSCRSSNLYLFSLPGHRFNLLVLLQFLTNLTRVQEKRGTKNPQACKRTLKSQTLKTLNTCFITKSTEVPWRRDNAIDSGR
jgi:hypothetical protein